MTLECRQVLEGFTEAVVAATRHGQIVYLNHAAERLLGWSAEALIGLPLTALMPTPLHAAQNEVFARAMATREAHLLGRPVRIPAQRRDGTEIDVELCLSTMPGDNGEELLIASLRDFREGIERERPQARRHPLQTQQRGLAFLSEASSLLSASLDYQATLEQVARLVVPDLAAWCYVDIVEDGVILPLAVAHVDPAKIAWAHDLRDRYPLEPDHTHGVPHVLRTGQAELYPVVSDTLLVEVARDHEHLQLLRRLGMTSAMVVPLIARGRVLGAITFVAAESGSHYGPDDLTLAQELANRAAVAIDNARLYRAAQAAEERLSITLQSIGDAVIATDEQGRVEFMNPVAESVTGWTREDAAGRPLTEVFRIVNEETGETVENPVMRVLREGQIVGSANHTVLVARDGREIPIDDSVAPMRDEQGKITGVVLTFHDTTERRRAEEALRTSEQRLRRVLQNMPVMMDAFAADGSIVVWNCECEQVTGYAADEIVGNPRALEQLYPDPLYRERMLKAWNERGNDYRNWEWDLSCRDGSTRTVAWSNISDRFPVSGWATWGVGVDVTERKRAEEALRQGEERLRLALDAGRMGTWEWHIPTGEVCWSETLECLHGLAPGSFEGTFEAFQRDIHPEDRDGVLEAITRALAEGKDLYHEYRIMLPDGAVRWIQGRGRLYRDASGQPVRMVGICMDIAERKGLEEALRERAAALVEADRQKDDFLAMLAHELRNPLAPIRNVAQLLRLRGTSDPSVRRASEIVERQVGHLARLVDDLLDVSRITRGKIELCKEPIDLAIVIRQALENLAPLMTARRHELSLSLPTAPLWLEADPVRLVQVVQNLLENAAKYTEPGGRIWVSAAGELDEVVLRVRDTGNGIAPELLPQIFDLFTQAERTLDRSQGGLGLGLTLVRRLVAMHGGSVSVQSPGLGQGSEFVVRLPHGPRASQVREEATLVAVPASPSPRRVLVVDDNEDAAASLAELLQLSGHQVRVVHNGAATLEAAASSVPDVIFLDIGLPGMSGFEVARQLRKRSGFEDVTIVAVTGYGQTEDRQRAAEAGFDHHLVKPVDVKRLESLLTATRKR
jgi:two-component system CheB/CheR fusion protein